MPYAPVDLLVVRFPDSTFTGEIAAELASLVESNTVRVLDLIFVSRGAEDTVDVIELADLDDPVAAQFDAFIGDLEAMLAPEDAQAIGAGLEVGGAAALVLYENVWAGRFAEAVRNKNGEVLVSERIPRDIVEAMLEDEMSPA